MTAIAIPIPSSFEGAKSQHHDSARSPFSRSPFRQLSLSNSNNSPNKIYTITSPSRDLPFDTVTTLTQGNSTGW